PRAPRVTSFTQTDTLLLPLASADDLATLLARSTKQPVLLFKHSDTCGMSWQAREEVHALLADPQWDTPIFLVTVQASRRVSNEIAHRLQISNASPQLLQLSVEEVLWQASHLAITADAMRHAVTAAASQDQWPRPRP